VVIEQRMDDVHGADPVLDCFVEVAPDCVLAVGI
jgi:hypothetical protein